MKAGWEARVRVRLEKQREKEEKEADEQRETEDRERDLVGWATKLRKDQEVIAPSYIYKLLTSISTGNYDQNQGQNSQKSCFE